jgi:glycosyltransferase involved in cell wall biosynthesis
VKVLYVEHTSLISGAEAALLDLLEALPSTVVPTVICPPGPLSDTLRAMGIDVVEFAGASGGLRLHPRHTLRTVRQILSSAGALRRTVAATGADVVHANSLRAGLIAGCGLTFRATPTVVHIHDALPPTRAAGFVRSALRLTADAVITISEYTTENFAGGGSRRGIHMLHNPLDTERFDPEARTRRDARAQLGLEAHDKLIGLVAQITPWKGQEVAIRALSLLHRRHPDARLLVVGEVKFADRATRYDNVAYLKLLHRLVAELGLEQHVEFWGERSDVATITRALDVLVGPSWEEPFGRSVIEAMAMETAVVATNVGGPAEYIEDGVDGVLLSPKDIPAWAAAVAGLFDDPDQRLEMGRRGSRKVRKLFERRDYAAKVVHVYEEVVRDAAAAPAPPLGRLSTARRARRSQTGTAVEHGRRRTRLRILFVEHSSVIGGGQHSLLELMRVLRPEYDVILACPAGSLARTAALWDIPIEWIPDSQLTFKLEVRGISRELVRALQARRALRAHIGRLRPDVVHANSLRAGLLVGNSRDETAVVAHCRDLLPPSRAAAVISSVILRRSSAVVAVSKAAAVRLAGPQWAKRGVVVIDNPVDPERFDPERFESGEVRRLLSVDGAPVLGVIAQITPWKGQTRAVRVLARVRRTHPDAQLLIVGETKFVTPATRFDNRAYERELRELVRQLGLSDAVRFLGERDDVERVIAALDVVLVPSREEPFGRSVIEALAMGVPVVATNAGGPAEVIRPGKDGIVLAPDDLDDWAEAVRSMVRRGRRHESRTYALERFSPARHASEVVSVYERAIARAAS